MNINTLKKTFTLAVLGLVLLLGTGEITNAQSNRNDRKRQQQIDKKERKDQQRRVRIEDQRIRTDQRREQTRIRNIPVRRNNTENNRYRVNRNGTYYETNNRGAELLKHAVNAGYQEGYRAGRDDRNSRRRDSYQGSSVYRKGNYGYQSYVTSAQYQYYFQQGFQKGYDDGFNSRYEYGTNNNGSLNILGTILGTILNIESY
jgi:hypothetical protein